MCLDLWISCVGAEGLEHHRWACKGKTNLVPAAATSKSSITRSVKWRCALSLHDVVSIRVLRGGGGNASRYHVNDHGLNGCGQRLHARVVWRSSIVTDH